MELTDIKYNHGHNLSIEIITNILTNLGYIDIKDYDYKERNFYSNGLRPDFICKKYKNNGFGQLLTIAVEIGKINNNGENKILKLLEEYDEVVHIYTDDKFFLLNIMLYQRKLLLPKDIMDLIKNSQEIFMKCNNIIENEKLHGGK